MAIVLALLPDPTARACLRSSPVSSHHEVRFAETWAELHALAMRVPARLAVVDPYRRAVLQLHECERFRNSFPSVILVPYTRLMPERINDILRLARLGVQSIIVRGQDDTPSALLALLNDSVSMALPEIVLNELGGVIPAPVTPLFMHVIRQAHRPLHPRILAQVRGCHEKTLRDRLRSGGLPSTMKLITWARLFHAAHALQDRRRTTESVARSLRFPSASALRSQLLRYAGIRPKDLAAEDGLRRLLLRFRQRHASGDWGGDYQTLTSVPSRGRGRRRYGSANGMIVSTGRMDSSGGEKSEY